MNAMFVGLLRVNPFVGTDLFNGGNQHAIIKTLVLEFSLVIINKKAFYTYCQLQKKERTGKLTVELRRYV